MRTTTTAITTPQIFFAIGRLYYIHRNFVAEAFPQGGIDTQRNMVIFMYR